MPHTGHIRWFRLTRTWSGPVAVAAAFLGAVLDGGGASALLAGTIAGAAVLSVEPVVHRR